MAIESIVAKLRKRIHDIRDRREVIGEENTKATLIEPLLSALGWDIEELEEVRREYKRKPQDKPVDYALFLIREPRLFIEAKALGEDLTNRKWASQVLGYATVVGVRWCVLTDGDEYRLYNAHAEVDVDEKLFRSVRISISDEGQQIHTLQTLTLLSKEKMGENLLNVLWNAHFVDRKVKGAVEQLFKTEDLELIKLLRKKTTGLGRSEILASLKRAAPIRLEFPVVRVNVDAKSKQTRPGNGPRTSRARAEKKKSLTNLEVRLTDLIAAGLINAPLGLEKEYKGVHLKAVVQTDGTVLLDSISYDSLSTAGGMARKSVIGSPPDRAYPQTNGWTFWKFRNESGKLMEIDVLRQQYLKSPPQRPIDRLHMVTSSGGR
ncbi:MAG: restriction endonuclease [Terriglobia bacterium]|nr:MAG: restriction endonuclease [Terriglobia bacterium]